MSMRQWLDDCMRGIREEVYGKGVSLRRHQKEILSYVQRIILDIRTCKNTSAQVVPGGGKTKLGISWGKSLIRNDVIDKLLILVPRRSLAEQFIQDYNPKPGSEGNGYIEIANPKKELFPDRTTEMGCLDGHVTTYQNLAAGKNYSIYANAIEERGLRIGLITDEAQFLGINNVKDVLTRYPDGSSNWAWKLERIQRVAFKSLSMSGGFVRQDNRETLGVSWDYGDPEKYQNPEYRYPCPDIDYTLRDGIAEKAIVRIDIHVTDGKVEYLHNGVGHIRNLSDDDREENSRSRRTYLGDEKAVRELIDRMIGHWTDRRRKHYDCRMIFIADTINDARRIHEYLKSRCIRSVIAVSEDGSNALRELRNFRNNKGHAQALVTVGMAHIGYDCPDIKYVAYLSRVRSYPYMLQAFLRAGRVDNNIHIPPEEQHGFVYTIDDPATRRFANYFRGQVELGISDTQQYPIPRGHSGTYTGGMFPYLPDYDFGFKPIRATPGECATEALHGRISAERMKEIEELKRMCPGIAGLPPSIIDDLMIKCGR